MIAQLGFGVRRILWVTCWRGGQLLTQNDSSLVLPIIREVLENFGGAMAPPMHKVAPPLNLLDN